MKIRRFKHEFVHRIPHELQEGIIYICIECSIVMHKCACGCGEEVATPLGKKQWRLIFNGETISLLPSIGNWNYNCRSHYIIRENKAEWASSYSDYICLKETKKKRTWWKKLLPKHEDR